MSLTGALNIGRTALFAQQTAIQVTGNNLANSATASYHRQSITLVPAPGQMVQSGMFAGRGVQVAAIERQVDNALESRIRDSFSNESAANKSYDILSQIESLESEFSEQGLSTQLSDFFNIFSQLANSPQDYSVRSLVVEQGKSISDFIQNLRNELSKLRSQADKAIDQDTAAANDLLDRISLLNQQIASQEGGAGGSASLRDTRDELLGQLSQYMDISVIEQSSGSMDVYVGSLPLVLGSINRGLEVQRQTVDGQQQINLIISADKSQISPTSGSIGALIESRNEDINGAITALDEFTNQFIYQVNRVHSQGQATDGFTSVTGTSMVEDADAALDSTAAGLAFTPTHGSFQLHVTQLSTGQRVATTIDIDLDNVDTANNTSLNDVVAQINANVANVTASVTADGRLKLATSSGDFEISFSDDSSGVLACLGVNSFFSGDNAFDIAVNPIIADDPSMIAAGQDHVQGSNKNALAIAELATKSLDELGGASLTDLWNRHVEDYSVRTSKAKQQAEVATVVRQNLQSQQQSVSGVSSDEEAINLLAYQRAYQAAARFLSVVDQMYQTLLQLV